MLVLYKTLKVKLILLLLVVASYMNTQERWMLGLAGIRGHFYYSLNKRICFGPEIKFFPYQDVENGYESTIIDLNINVYYIFDPTTHRLGFYPFSGINCIIEKERMTKKMI